MHCFYDTLIPGFTGLDCEMKIQTVGKYPITLLFTYRNLYLHYKNFKLMAMHFYEILKRSVLCEYFFFLFYRFQKVGE